MIEIEAKAVLLDVEGTTSATSYVHDVLFPFARDNARSYLERCWDDQNTLEACDLIAKEAGHGSSYDWLYHIEKRSEQIDMVMDEINKLMEQDSKSKGLKELQGFIWAEAYSSGLLCSQVFVDVPQALACWRATKLLMAIYSSGSATAQRVFFRHTEFGDLSDYFSGFFDTSCGPKKEKDSYIRIAKLLNQETKDVVFFSDLVDELDAARDAGMQTVLLLRPDNAKQAESTHKSIPSFYDVRVVKELNGDGMDSVETFND